MRNDNTELPGLSSRMSVLSSSCLLWVLETLTYNRIALLKIKVPQHSIVVY